MQWRRTSCRYHPTETITNFCREKTCLMPLCPTCIRQHSQYHTEASIKPQYYNISETLDEVDNSMRTCIFNLEQDKARNVEIIKRIKCMDGVIKQKLSTARKYVFQILEQAFQNLQTQLQEALERVNSEQGLHSLAKAEKINDRLMDSLVDLQLLKEGLNSDKIMGSTIIFLKDKQPESIALHKSLSSYLDNNESYAPKIQFNNEARNQILHNLSKLIKIEGRKDVEKYRDKTQETSVFKSRMNRDPIRNQKLEKSYTPEKSTNYLRSSMRDGFSSFNNNSPYRQRGGDRLSPSKDLLRVNEIESYRSNFRGDYETKSKRQGSYKRDYQVLYQPIT